jgi:hypothetical protein
MGTCGSRGYGNPFGLAWWVCVNVSPHCYCCSPFPPCEQLLAAVVGGATVVVVPLGGGEGGGCGC